MLCILIRLIIDYEFSYPILISFPLFFVGHLNPDFWFSLSLFPHISEKKEIISLVYPILVNIILWFPIKNVYHSVYGIVWVEKWKSFFSMLRSVALLLLVCFFGREHVGGYFWGALISIAYYIYLRYAINRLKDERILVEGKISDLGNRMNLKKNFAVLFIHIVILFSLNTEKESSVRIMQERLPEKKLK